MITTPLTPAELIAPCGINCRLCYAYIRSKKTCPGCRTGSPDKSSSCAGCKIKNCVKLAALGSYYCIDCEDFPCFLIKRLDKRYRTKYSAQPIQNLHLIRLDGIAAFLEKEDRQWACPHCGAILCMHRSECPSCGATWR